jgi:hypothetical protein
MWTKLWITARNRIKKAHEQFANVIPRSLRRGIPSLVAAIGGGFLPSVGMTDSNFELTCS